MMSLRLHQLWIALSAAVFLVGKLFADEVPTHLPGASAGKVWKLMWRDEFEGSQLDETKWEVPPDGRRRDGWWKRQAVTLDGTGHLSIQTLVDDGQYIDGCVRTKGKFAATFGYYEARMQLQRQPGHWSAFWMMGDGVTTVGDQGRDGTEIDIMEKPWLDHRVQHTLHWDGYGKAHRSEGKIVDVPGVMEGFHTFGLLWLPDEYVYFVDGQETWRTRAGGVCQAPLYLKLSDEIGPWGGDIRQAQLPDQFLVDYVRVYQLVDEVDASQFVRLFDGKTLQGWHTLPGGKWEVQNEVLVGSSEKSETRHGLLVSDQKYRDFTLRLKFQLLSGNSGFYFRSEKVDDEVGLYGFQAEIHDNQDSGGLYETGGRTWVVQPDPQVVQKSFRTADWNQLDITARGGNIRVLLNGVETAKLADDPGRPEGHFALQLHGGQDMLVKFKDIEVRAEEPSPSAPAERAGAASSWHRDDNFVAFRQGANTVWQFNFGTELDVPYFHPLGTIDGQVLSLDRPADHVWHHGLWFCWKFVNQVNYWEPNPNTNKPDGRTAWEPPRIETHTDGSALLELNLAYRPAESAGQPVLTETRQIAISPPDADGVYHLDWTSLFTAGDTQVVLDRVPPQEQSWGGYAGLSLRFPQQLIARRGVSSQGSAEFGEGGRYRGHANAMEYNGMLDGEAVGVAFLDHPMNPRHPTPWYLIDTADMGYMNAALLTHEPYVLQAGEQLTLRYRVVIHPQRWDVARLSYAHAQYSREHPQPPAK